MSENTSKPVALVLGGTVPHIELIRQLKERGYYTILVDYLENPPARPYADLHLRESTLDEQTVLSKAQEYHASLVISACIDRANITCCYVLEKLGLHVPYSYETALDVTDKMRMKKIMIDNGIATAPYQVVSDANEKISVQLPCVVKPLDSYGSRGVRRVANAQQMLKSLQEALHTSRSAKAIVETFIPGMEISVYCYVLHGHANILLTNHRYVYFDENSGVMPGYAMIYPAELSPTRQQKLQNVVDQIVVAFGFENTPLTVQIKFKGDDPYVLELMPRIGGGMSFKNINDRTGFDMISAAIDSFLGVEPPVEYHAPKEYSSTNYLYASAAYIDRFVGVEELIRENVIDSFNVLHDLRGAIDYEDMSTAARVASFSASANSTDELLRKMRLAMERIDMLDKNGNSILRREINVY